MKINKLNIEPLAREYLNHLTHLCFSIFGCEPKGFQIGQTNTHDDLLSHDKMWMLNWFQNAGEHEIEPPSSCFDPREQEGSGKFIICGLRFTATDEDYIYFKTINPVLQLLWINDLVDFLQRRTNSVVAAYGESMYNTNLMCYWGYDLAESQVNNIISYKKFEHFYCEGGTDLDTLIKRGRDPFADSKFSELSNEEKCYALEWCFIRDNNKLDVYIHLARAYERYGLQSTADMVVLHAYTSWSLGSPENLSRIESLFPEITGRYCEKYGRPRGKTNSPFDNMIESLTDSILDDLRNGRL